MISTGATHIKKFKIPFETYNYRDFIWKANYSNERIVEIAK